ncbi:MAG: PDZ domain-containing protein [Acidobacteria bacterium]|nr:PDZ domain-containing protein [Acidobacteriota bacterium]
MGANEYPLNPGTPSPEMEPAQPAREERANPKYVAVIAAVAAAILLGGALLRPKDKPAEPPVSQTEMTRLRRLSQKTSLESMTGFFSETAAETSSRLVRLQGVEGTGLGWRGGGIITAAGPNRFPDSVDLIAPTGVRIQAQTAIASPDLPIARLQVPPNSQLPAVSVRPARELKLGEWVLAISRPSPGNYVFAPGWYSGIVSSTCREFVYQRVLLNLPLTPALLGGGLFDLEGNLLAVMIQCEESVVAMAAEQIEAALQEGSSFSSRLLRRYGMRIGPLGESTQAYFNVESGFLITEVWKGSWAEAVDLIPGDILVALDDKESLTEGDLVALVQPTGQEVFQLQVRRGRRTLRVSLPAQGSGSPPVVPGESASGLVLEGPASGYRIEEVEPGSRAAKAGVQPGDRLMRIGNTPVSNLRAAQRVLSSQDKEPVFLVLDQGHKWVGLLVEAKEKP